MNTSLGNGVGAWAPSQNVRTYFEVGKELQILVANFAVERAVEILTVHRGHSRCESGEVKSLLRPRQTGERQVLRVVRYIWKGVRRR